MYRGIKKETFLHVYEVANVQMMKFACSSWEINFVSVFFNFLQNYCCENCFCTLICILCYLYCEGKGKSWQLEFRRLSAKVHNKASQFTSNVSKLIQKLYLGRDEYRSPACHYEQWKVQVKSDSTAQAVNFGRSCDSNFPQKTFCCVLRKFLIFKSYKSQSVQTLKPKDKC